MEEDSNNDQGQAELKSTEAQGHGLETGWLRGHHDSSETRWNRRRALNWNDRQGAVERIGRSTSSYLKEWCVDEWTTGVESLPFDCTEKREAAVPIVLGFN